MLKTRIVPREVPVFLELGAARGGPYKGFGQGGGQW